MQGGLFDDDVPLENEAGHHALYLASAGTGKTYRLANHFAALLVNGAEPQSVLATTFTRKAAGEILDRVLARLCDGAREGAKGDEARAAIADAIPGTPEHSAPEFRAVLHRLVRRVDRFQVRTLDSFFVRLAQAFASELDLSAEWRIADPVEERRLLSEDIARMLDDLAPEERLELVRAIVASASRNAATALQATVEGGDRYARIATPDAWNAIQAPEPPPDETIADAYRSIAEFQVPLTAKKERSKSWTKWFDPLRELLLSIEDPAERYRHLAGVEAAFGSGVPKAVREWTAAGMPDGGPLFYGKEVDPDFAGALQLVDHDLACARLADLVARNTATRALLERFAETDRELRAETGAYRFEDFPLALLLGPVQADRGQWLSDLGYRLDGRIDHLLLDEFQDTSPLQWWLVEPLAAEILAGGMEPRTFFCVGDVKQSIYGWRGGDPRLLSGLPERFPALAPERMVVSYRSASVVLDAVNLVFGGIAKSAALAKEGRDAANDATTAWLADFADHAAARENLTGEVRTWRARPPRFGESDLDPALELAVERVADYHERFDGASIAILVRAKKNIAQLRFLLKRAGLESSDEGGNPLTDSMAVTWVLALLQLADHPGDGVAGLQIARAEFGGPFALERAELRDARERADALARVSRAVRRALLDQGYGGFCEARAAELRDRVGEWDERRLEQLTDLALGYDERAGLRPIDFVSLVREERVPDPTASRIKVMTVHASKGLEFDVVVLPELGKLIRLTPEGVLAFAPDAYTPPTVLSVSPKKDLLAHHELLNEAYEDAQRRTMTDALSSLYVAMTRAAHALELILPALPEGKKGPSTALSYASLVEPAFESKDGPVRAPEVTPDDTDPAASATQRATLQWEHPESTDDWYEAEESEEAQYVDEPAFELAPAPAAPPSIAPSRVGRRAGPEVELSGRAQRIGNLVHHVLSGLERVDAASFDAVDAARACRALEGGSDAKGLIDEAVTRVAAALDVPEVAEVLAPPADVRVLCERSFDVEVTDLDEGPRRVRGAYDRLHVRTEDGAVTGVTLVEFKTGAATSIGEVAADARPQVELYRATLAALFGLEVAAVDARLVWLPEGGAAGLIAMA